jgi:hypothetical protein
MCLPKKRKDLSRPGEVRRSAFPRDAARGQSSEAEEPLKKRNYADIQSVGPQGKNGAEL